jgi:RNA polymerase sigma factor (sigma-70 family)
MQNAIGAFAPAVTPIHYVVQYEDDDQPTLEAVDPAPTPEQTLEQTQALIAVRLFVASLPDFERYIVERLFHAGLSQAQLAAEMGVNKMAVSRAFASIRKKGLIRLADFRGATLPQ